jgi:hypothetical protein
MDGKPRPLTPFEVATKALNAAVGAVAADHPGATVAVIVRVRPDDGEPQPYRAVGVASNAESPALLIEYARSSIRYGGLGKPGRGA